jgi:hypothetical protein
MLRISREKTLQARFARVQFGGGRRAAIPFSVSGGAAKPRLSREVIRR